MNLSRKIVNLIWSLILLTGAVLLVFQIINFFSFLLILAAVSVLTFAINTLLSTFTPNKEAGQEISPNPVLFSARSVFPFQVFPDRYIIQEKNLYVVRKSFFHTGWTEMLPIKDIASVRMYAGPLFASIFVERRGLPQNSFELRDLWKKDATKIKEILDGLIMKEAKIINMSEKIPASDKAKILTKDAGEKEVEKEM